MFNFKVERDTNTRILLVQACGISEQALGGTDGLRKGILQKKRDNLRRQKKNFFNWGVNLIKLSQV